MVPPVIAVATFALTNRVNALVTTTGVNTVEAEVVDTAEPSENHETPSKLPCNCTEPADTPALEVTTIVALVLTTPPSSAVPPPVAETADREARGLTPVVYCWTPVPEFESINNSVPLRTRKAGDDVHRGRPGNAQSYTLLAPERHGVLGPIVGTGVGAILVNIDGQRMARPRIHPVCVDHDGRPGGTIRVRNDFASEDAIQIAQRGRVIRI